MKKISINDLVDFVFREGFSTVCSTSNEFARCHCEERRNPICYSTGVPLLVRLLRFARNDKCWRVLREG